MSPAVTLSATASDSLFCNNVFEIISSAFFSLDVEGIYNSLIKLKYVSSKRSVFFSDETLVVVDNENFYGTSAHSSIQYMAAVRLKRFVTSDTMCMNRWFLVFITNRSMHTCQLQVFKVLWHVRLGFVIKKTKSDVYKTHPCKICRRYIFC